MFKNLILAVSLLFTLFASLVLAKVPEFNKGPVIKDYGPHVQIPGVLTNPRQQNFKIIFDISEPSEDGTINRNYNTVARFMNMHVAAGVPKENLKVAVVIHGKATEEMLENEFYKKRMEVDNVNDELLAALLDNGVEIYVCGQSASYYQIGEAQLKPGIKMALSAMTANQLLQQQGYILNPF